MTGVDSSAQHPSAARRETGVAQLMYGLIAGPVTWLLAQIFSSTIAKEACFPKYEPLPTPVLSGVQIAQVLALAVSVLVSASAASIAYNAWRRTRGEHQGGGAVLMEIGEGRSRFMALAGVLTSTGFMLGTLFSFPAIVFAPAC